jgi:hypothetical protein
LSSNRAPNASLGRAKATKNASPVSLASKPPCRANARRKRVVVTIQRDLEGHPRLFP